MLMIHGSAFAVEAVANLQGETSTHVSAQRGVGAILLGTRALLRLYSTPPPSLSFYFPLVTQLPPLTVTRTYPFLYLSDNHSCSVCTNLLPACACQCYQLLPLILTVANQGFPRHWPLELVRRLQRSFIGC